MAHTEGVWTTYDFYDTRDLHGEGNIGRIFVRFGTAADIPGVRAVIHHASRAAAVDDAVSRLRDYVSHGHAVALTVSESMESGDRLPQEG